MLYCIFARDVPDSSPRRAIGRPKHLERLQEMVDEGRVVVAGPMPAVDAPDSGSAGFTGSVTIAEFDSLEDARAWAESDPYVAAGAYESVEVYPFKQVFP